MLQDSGPRAASGTRPETEWVAYLIMAFLLANFLASVWNLRESRLSERRMLEEVRKQHLAMAEALSSDVFVTTTGWRVGQFPPDIEVRSIGGAPHRLRDLAAELDVLYLSWERCPICVEHFPRLNHVAERVADSGGAFALVILRDQSTLSQLADGHQWTFPVYEISQADMLELNIEYTPAVLIFRRGVLGGAFRASSIEPMIERIVAELNGASGIGRTS